ncbi:methyl-accepting chemotaxis protein [Mesobacillus zeae]|uniref:Methyl-accepting chemotaxis protein n=1 Tax=Mesobacillus zeae TaxID=1917180 RepID=A0A398BFD7_9BACI|nr:methyl-accepting chemotaxis protein [Mesobacillus zeae]RID87498.1 methyl-accepting chemotaxis protein [Mesobacillus zeae]
MNTRKTEMQKNKFTMTIKRKLIISLLALLIIPTLTVGFMSYNKAANEIDKSTLASATESVKVLDQILSNSLEPKMADAYYFANKIDRTSYSGDKKEEAINSLKEYYALHPEIVAIYVGTEKGEMLRAPAKQYDPGYDPRKRPWYTFAMENKGDTVITEPYLGASTGSVLVTVAQTVKDGSGVIAIDLNMDAIKESADDIKIGKKGYPFVVSVEGNYIVHPTEPAGKKSKMFTHSMLGKDHAIHSFKYKEQSKKLTFVTNKITGWKIVGLMDVSEAKDQAKPILYTTLIVVGIFIVIGVLISYMTVLSITKPLKALAELTDKVSKGDLTEKFDNGRGDEIGLLGKSFNTMIDSLRDLIRHVSEKSHALASSSEQLNASSEQNNSATEQVATAIQQVAAGTEKQTDMAAESAHVVREMSTGLVSILENAENVSRTSVEAAEIVKSGEGAITHSIQQMTNIHDTVNDLGRVVHTLGERSHEISKIIDVISEIAGQTNLLALNAAIEAARAGEQGKGFAVVADEVRKLAEQSAKATETIRSLISSIQVETGAAVDAMNKGTDEVEKGITVVNEAGISFKKIQEFVDAVSSQIQNVAASVQQMNRGTEQVVEMVTGMDEISQKTAHETQEVSAATEEQLASMQEIAASAESLANMAEELQDSISSFKI